MKLVIIAVAAGLAVASGAVAAADLKKGAEKAGQICAACHGKDGNTPIDPSYPKLGGQHADYLAQALRGYRSGTRQNAIMAAQAKQLSTADIQNLAAYYASLPGSMSHKR